MEVQRWIYVSPPPVTGTIPTPPAAKPMSTPTFVPLTSSSLNTTNDQSSMQTALMSVVAFFIMAVILLCFAAYVNCTRQRNANALPGDAATATEVQQRLDLARTMSPEDRKVYVTNFLKTQKFEETNTFTRRKKMPSNKSLPIQKDEDVEANLSIRSTGTPYPGCAICLDPFKRGEDVCSSQNKLCNHEFHLTCIVPWLLKSQECPCCRRDYLSVENVSMELDLRESATQNLSRSLHSI